MFHIIIVILHHSYSVTSTHFVRSGHIYISVYLTFLISQINRQAGIFIHAFVHALYVSRSYDNALEDEFHAEIRCFYIPQC